MKIQRRLNRYCSWIMKIKKYIIRRSMYVCKHCWLYLSNQLLSSMQPPASLINNHHQKQPYKPLIPRHKSAPAHSRRTVTGSIVHKPQEPGHFRKHHTLSSSAHHTNNVLTRTTTTGASGGSSSQTPGGKTWAQKQPKKKSSSSSDLVVTSARIVSVTVRLHCMCRDFQDCTMWFNYHTHTYTHKDSISKTHQ